MGEVLHKAQLNHPICQQAQAPLAAAVGRFGTGQTDQLRFLLSVEFEVVFAVWGLPFNTASKAALAEAPSDPCDRTGGYFQRFGRAIVGPSRPLRTLIDFQQNANAGLLSCWTLPAPEAFEEIGAL